MHHDALRKMDLPDTVVAAARQIRQDLEPVPGRPRDRPSLHIKVIYARLKEMVGDETWDAICAGVEKDRMVAVGALLRSVEIFISVSDSRAKTHDKDGTHGDCVRKASNRYEVTGGVCLCKKKGVKW